MNKKTFEQWAVDELISYGMFESDAQTIVQLAKKDSVLESMQDRWNDDISGYPSNLLVGVWLPIKRVALQWINTNRPLAWNKPLFEE